MPAAIMYDEEHYVLLEPGRSEEFLTAEEMLEQLERWAKQAPAALPADIAKLTTPQAQAQALLDRCCDLEVEGRSMQWYAVRLEKEKPVPD
jgi:hypothetical protein